MPIGFASYGKLEEPKNTFKLHKLYLLPSEQNKGFGRILLNEVEKEVANLAANHLHLNVNRKNPALSFYEKLGYEIIETVDIPFAEFWLNDYVLAKKIA
jgi:GNAT superfamily N-acetyltransferase